MLRFLPLHITSTYANLPAPLAPQRDEVVDRCDILLVLHNGNGRWMAEASDVVYATAIFNAVTKRRQEKSF
jgi:hypothetical protein